MMNLLSSLILLGSLAVTLGCNPEPGATNIALTGEASQVSDFSSSASAKNAIDGGKDTNHFMGSCTHTAEAKDPWWTLDLKKTYKISNVVITNRGDCCAERLLGAEIRIGNSPDNKNPVCGKVTSVASSTLSFCCNGMEGRYISVVIPGRTGYLSLCEVEVYGSLACNPEAGATNIALTGEASQVSDFSSSAAAKNAIDGGKDTNHFMGSCSHTAEAKDPWWTLDLKKNYKISNVVITNRGDCCAERLLGAEVRIGNSPDNNNPACGKVTSVASSTLSFCCNGMEGRYISVVIPGRTGYLSLCEVEVYGDLVTEENKVCW